MNILNAIRNWINPPVTPLPRFCSVCGQELVSTKNPYRFDGATGKTDIFCVRLACPGHGWEHDRIIWYENAEGKKVQDPDLYKYALPF